MSDASDISAFEQKIIDDAEGEVSSIVAKGEDKREGILAAARSQASLAAKNVMARAQEQAEAERKQALAGAEMESRNLILLARERAVEAAFTRAREMLEEFRRTAAYRDKLKDLIAEGAAAIGGDEIEVVLSGREREERESGFAGEIEEYLEKRLGRPVKVRLSADDGLKDAGALVRSRDGRTGFDNTFSARWKRSYPRLRQIVYKTIFKD